MGRQNRPLGDPPDLFEEYPIVLNQVLVDQSTLICGLAPSTTNYFGI
jgi:hypothetical protein